MAGDPWPYWHNSRVKNIERSFKRNIISSQPGPLVFIQVTHDKPGLDK